MTITRISRLLTIMLAAAASLTAYGQSIRISEAGVTYVHSSANTGDMTFNGSVLNVEGRQYLLAPQTSMTVTADGVDDNTVCVTYNGTQAEVVVAGNIARYLTVNANGADVSILAAPELQQSVEYTLRGTSTDGSFYMDGEYAATVILDNLTLTNADSAAINIQDGKLITINLVGQSTIADAQGMANSACLYVNGHAKFTGAGTLNVTGNAKHGITGDEHLIIEGGTINVNAVGDGLHVSEYFKQTGGSLTINAQGDGIDIGFKGVNKVTKDQYADNGFAFLEGGTMDITTTGEATRGVKADSTILVAGITATVRTTGNACYDATKNDISSAAAIKTGGAFSMTSGTLTLSSTGSAGKGINATDNITLAGGKLDVVTTGAVYVYGAEDSKPHGVKTDADINISGGTILVAASGDSGSAFKTDYYFTISGGTVMAVGGKASKPTSATQKYYTYTGVSVTPGQTLSYNGVSVTMPDNYSVPSGKVLVSSPTM